jgi:hypothetical protein
MGTVNCKAYGVVGEPNLYEGMEVYVLYYDEDRGWVIEEGVVESGQVEIDSDGPLTDQTYYIGLKYTSLIKTLPIRQQGELNKRGRVSHVDVYLNESRGGQITIGDEEKSFTDDIKDNTSKSTGRKRTTIGSGYKDEIFVQIETEELYALNILGIDVKYRQYEE